MGGQDFLAGLWRQDHPPIGRVFPFPDDSELDTHFGTNFVLKYTE